MAGRKILVTGAGGMIGSYAREVFAGDELILTDLQDLDVTDREEVFSAFGRTRPDFVLHLAAETDVDKCEKEVDHAFRANTYATQNIALACKQFDSTMIYISTGYVFNGSFGSGSTELDIPEPLSIYAKSKFQGEQVVEELLEKYYIFRSDWMIGGGPGKDKKFVGKMIEICRTKKQIEAVNDITGSPTFGRDFVRNINKVIGTGKYDLYHLVNKGICTRYDMAVEIVKDMRFDVKVIPVSSDRFPLPAPRPRSSGLINYRLDQMGLDEMPPWQDSLGQYLKEWKM